MSDKAGPTSPDNANGDLSAHRGAVVEGVTTALSWLTVVPLRGARVFDRITGRRAIAAAPLAGLVPATAAVVIAAGFITLASAREVPLSDVTALLAGVLIVVAAQLLTRGMHLDGLADVTDALASYKPPEAAREVLRDPNTGPMAIGAITATMLTSAASFGVLLSEIAADAAGVSDGNSTLFTASVFGYDGNLWRGVVCLCLPFVASRAAAVAACWHGFHPFSSSGFGGLVAGTQSSLIISCWWLALSIVAGCLIGVGGTIACVLSLAVALQMTRHCVKRFGGVNGDVLGAVIEVSCALCAVTLAIVY